MAVTRCDATRLKTEEYQEFRKSLKHFGALMCDEHLGQTSFKSDKFGYPINSFKSREYAKTKLEFQAPKDFDIFRTYEPPEESLDKAVCEIRGKRKATTQYFFLRWENLSDMCG